MLKEWIQELPNFIKLLGHLANGILHFGMMHVDVAMGSNKLVHESPKGLQCKKEYYDQQTCQKIAQKAPFMDKM